MMKNKRSLTTLVILSALSGCQNLSPLTQKLPPPDALMVKDVMPIEQKEVEESPVVQPEKELYPVSGALLGHVSGEANSEKEGKYELNFDDADLAEVIKTILGDTLNLNYTISPKVMGKVSMKTTRRLAEDEMIPTLEMLLKMNGAVLIKKGSLYRVEPEAGALIGAPGAKLGLIGKGLTAGYQLRVVPLRYVGVAEMQKVIEPLMPPKSLIRADEVRNILLLAGSSDELESVIQTIQIFDVDFMRGMSVGLYPLKNVDSATIATELEKLLGESKGPLGGMFKIMPIERLNAILAVTPQPRYLDEVESWIERLDRYTAKRSGNMHVYRVQNVDAIELANTLAQIFGQSSGRTPSVSLAPGMNSASIGGSSLGSDSASSAGFGDSSASSLSGSSGGLSSGSTSSMGMGTGLGGSQGLSGGTGMSGSTGISGQMGSTNSASPGASFGSASSGGSRSRRSSAADLGNQMRIVADPANNALIIMAKAQDYKEIENVIKELDVLPLQVLIDANIVEVTLSGSLQYGLQWLFTHGQNAGARSDLTGASAINTIVDAATQAGGSAGGGFAYAFAGKDIKLVINALAKEDKVNVISSPSLMVLNNQQANINVGDRVPVSTGGGTVTAVGAQAPGIQYQESGVTLKVRPRVNSGGLVIMDVIQELSTPTDKTVGGITTSQFAQRKIQSQVAVNSGDTLALGGLISDTNSIGENGLPYLNKIPGLGWLFGATSKSTKRTELVVLLTPRVVEKRRDVTAVTNEFRRRLTGIKLEHSLDNPMQ